MPRDFLDLYNQNDDQDAGGDSAVTSIANGSLGADKATLSAMPSYRNRKRKKARNSYPPKGNRTELDATLNIDPRY